MFGGDFLGVVEKPMRLEQLRTMLSAYQPVEKERPHILALSCLYTPTRLAMTDVIRVLKERGLRDKVKVIVGGAPIDQSFADMIHGVKGLYVIFNSTVYPSTFKEIPAVLKWGQTNIDRVHGLVFITYRTAKLDEQKATALIDQGVGLFELPLLSRNRGAIREALARRDEADRRRVRVCVAEDPAWESRSSAPPSQPKSRVK